MCWGIFDKQKKKNMKRTGLIFLGLLTVFSVNSQTISNVTPNSGSLGTWSLPVTITGSNTDFSAATSTVVKVSQAGNELEVLSVGTITPTSVDFVLRIPFPSLLGAYDVEVYDQTNGTIILPGGFTVVTGPNFPFIVETSPDSVRQNWTLPIIISTENTHFSQATDNTIFLTQGTHTIYPVPGSITAVADDTIRAVFDFNLPFLSIGDLLNSHCGNSFDGILSDYQSIIIVDSTLSVDPVITDRVLDVYPNPTKDQINVNLPTGLVDFQLSVYNQLGQTVWTQSITHNTNNQYNIDISNMLNGTYIVAVQGDKKVYHARIIKE